MTIQIFLVEDDHEFGQTLLKYISSNPLLQPCGWATTVAHALEEIAESVADVYLVDLGLPDGTGLEVIKRVRQKQPTSKIMVLSTLGDSRHILNSLAEGAHGYMLKSDMPQDILRSIVTLVNEGGVLSGHASKVLIQRMTRPELFSNGTSDHDASSPLTPKEREVLQHTQLGLPAKGIAARLNISIFTVNQHLRSIYRKFNARNKMEAVQAARKQGLL